MIFQLTFGSGSAFIRGRKTRAPLEKGSGDAPVTRAMIVHWKFDTTGLASGTSLTRNRLKD